MLYSEFSKMSTVPWILAIALVAVRTETGIDYLDEADTIKIRQPAEEAGLESHDIDVLQILRNGEPDGPEPKPGEGYGQISCYSCRNCKDLLMKTPVTLCPYSADSAKMHTCITYVEKYNFLDRPWYVRGCSTNVGSCAEIKQMHEGMKDRKLNLKQCYECVGDLCNGVSISRSNPLVFLIFAPFLLKLVIL